MTQESKERGNWTDAELDLIVSDYFAMLSYADDRAVMALSVGGRLFFAREANSLEFVRPRMEQWTAAKGRGGSDGFASQAKKLNPVFASAAKQS